MFTNKHVVIALLVAPVLSILAWFAIGELVGEKPHPAEAGAVYPLLEKSNCRYASGRCELTNGDMELELEVKTPDTSPVLELRSSLPLQGVLVAVAPAGIDQPAGAEKEQAGPPPRAMVESDTTGTLWRLPLASALESGDRLRLVTSTADNYFTGDIATRFAQLDD